MTGSKPGNVLSAPERLSALRNTELMDSVSEQAFDRITRLVCRLLGSPTSLISLVDTSRQFFKSSCGLPPSLLGRRETPLSQSFCHLVVLSQEPFIVADAQTDVRVQSKIAPPGLGVAAYLGVPLRSPNGQVLGSLCAIDCVPRQWTADDLEDMSDLAAIVESEIELRDKARRARKLADENAVLAREYHHRVKNSLAVAASLVMLSGREARTVDELVKNARARLSALAQAHDALISEVDEVGLRELAGRLLQPYGVAGVETGIEGPVVLLRQTHVTPVCLLLHELATNSAKYGAFANEGSVAVRWSFVAKTRLRLSWHETSSSIRAGERSGFGSALIAIAAKQLGGELTSRWRDGSMEASIEFDGVVAFNGG